MRSKISFGILTLSGGVLSQSTVPFELYKTAEDCFKIDGEVGNTDLCTQCYSCTYSYFSDGAEGGKNCYQGPWGEQDTPFVMKNYCRNPSTSFEGWENGGAGVNDDFNNLECGVDEVLQSVYCSVNGQMYSTNEIYLYQLRRNIVSLPSSVDPGLPSNGFYSMRYEVTASAACSTDNCNAVNYESVNFESENSVRDTNLTCKSCVWNGVAGNENCLSDTENINDTQCAENEVCGVMITRMGDNYDGSNPNLETTNESITRGCVIDTMSSAKPETTIDQSRFFICESGPLCNIFGVDVNPDDISPLPRPGQWNKPLTLQEASIFCGRNYENCVACHTCVSSPAENRDICVYNPQMNPDSLQAYRKRYLDERSGSWTNNVCSVEVRDMGTYEYKDVVRSVIQISDEDLTNVGKAVRVEDAEFCKTDLCNGITDLEPEPVLNVRCFYCKADLTDSTNPCVSGDFSGIDFPLITETCDTGICRTVRNENFISRECQDGHANDKILEEIEGSPTGAASVTITTDGFICTGQMCNNNAIDFNFEIRDEIQEFIPSVIEVPVFDLTFCDDGIGDTNTNLCIECVSCESFVDDITLIDDPLYSNCIVDTSNSAHYFKLENGWPIYCALQTNRVLSSNGFKYEIKRGAVQGVDPSLITDVAQISSFRASRVTCAGDNCNNVSYDSLPIPPSISPRWAEVGYADECLKCDATSDDKDLSCFTATDIETVETCGAEAACTTLLTEEWDVTKNIIRDPTLSIQRGCRNITVAVDILDISVQIKDVWACSGEKCNDMPDANSPPFDDLPINIDPTFGDQEIPLDQVDIVCQETECIECLNCVFVYGLSESYPSEYPCSSSFFLRSYLDEKATRKYNHCISNSMLRENTKSYNRILSHYVESTESPEVPADFDYNGTVELSSTPANCPVCANKGDCQQPVSSLPHRSCPLLVCMDYEDEYRHFKDCAFPLEATEFNLYNVRFVFENGQTQNCIEPRCNAIGSNNYSPAPVNEPMEEQLVYPFPADEYPGIYPQDPADCMDLNNPNENSNLCISCYQCTYFLNDEGQEIGCKDPELEESQESIRQTFKTYCYPHDESQGLYINGMYQDFGQLECDPMLQVKLEVICAVKAELKSENDFFQYLLTREMISVSQSALGQQGPPQFGGFWYIEQNKTGTAYCNTPDCNDIDIQKPASGRNDDRLTCKTCGIVRNLDEPVENYGNVDCIDELDDVRSGYCDEGQVCAIEYNTFSLNYDGQNPFLEQKKEQLTRGCVNGNIGDAVSETRLTQSRTIICMNDLCNILDLGVDPEDLSPLPRPGKWDQPLNVAEIGLYCGQNQENCLQCITCFSGLDDPFNPCRNNADLGNKLTYRKRFFDDIKNEWVNNACSIVTATVLDSERSLTGVVRGVIQFLDTDLPALEIWPRPTYSYNSELTYCNTDLCNGVSSERPDSDIYCFYCESTDPNSECWLGLFENTDSQEKCSTGVCKTTQGTNSFNEDFIRRECEDNEILATEALAQEMNMFTVTVVGTAQSCSGSNCNNAYVNTELEILEENPVYEPMPVPNPVFDIELCNDLLQPRANTNKCIACYSCDHIINDSEDPDLETCITKLDEAQLQYFWKSENGIPTVCALRTDKTLSTSGYRYYIRRGAVMYMDPTLVGEGNTKVEVFRQSDFYCKDDSCNGYSVDRLPIPPMVSPRTVEHSRKRRAAPTCFTCSFDDNENIDTPGCLYNLEGVPALQCREEEVCSMKYVETYTISDDLFPNFDLSVERGCFEANVNNDKIYELISRKIETWVCKGPACNNQLEEPEMPPYTPFPTDLERYTRPLSSNDVATLCAWDDCKECQTCTQTYGVDEQYPSGYECETSTYKSSFLNFRDTSKLIYNHCAIKSGLQETNKDVKIRYVQHSVLQSDDEEFVMNPVTKTSFVRLSESMTRSTCMVCIDEEECKAPTRTCPSSQACREYLEMAGSTWVTKSRNCASEAENVLFLAGTTEITEQFEQTGCDGEACNMPGLENPYQPEPIVEPQPTDGPTDEPATTGSAKFVSLTLSTIFVLLL